MKREADHSDMGSPLKRSRSGDDVEVRFLIPSKIAGSIIGKGGNNITKLRTEYKATITVPDCPGPERMLTICAEPDTVVRVLGDIIPHIEDMSSREDRGGSSGGNRDGGEGVDVRMLVHQSQAGCIIGKQGLKVKDMREKTGARIKIYTNCCPSSTDRVVQISGRNQTCVDCVREILDLLRVTPVKGPNTPYDPHNYDEYYSDQYGGFRDGRRGMGGERGPMGAGPGVPGLMGGMGGLGGGRFGGRDGPRDGPREGRGGGPMGGGMGRDFGGRGPPRGGYGGGGAGAGGYGGGYGGGSGGYGSGGGAYGGQAGGGGGGYGGPGSGGGFGGPRGAANGMGNPAPMNVSGGGGGGNSGQRNSTQVTIPKDLAGAIIGKGGTRIRKIRNESGAGITIDEPLEGSNDRIITIVGLPNQIQMAQYLLQQSVHESSDRY